MVNKKLVDEPVFSFRLGLDESDGGEVLFGGVDDSAYTGDLTYVPLRRKAYWEVELEKIAFGDEEVELDNTGAAIDTGQYILPVCNESNFSIVLHRNIFDCPSLRSC